MANWPEVIAHAKAWVQAQSYLVTLRQVFYHLVATQVIPNSEQAYKSLSSQTAKRRRVHAFPELADGTREIVSKKFWTSSEDFADYSARVYAKNRTTGQENLIVIGVEKRGMRVAAEQQFYERGFLIVPCGGFTSASIDMELSDLIRQDGRKAILLYAGDFDASGESIYENLVNQVPFAHAEKVALTLDQVHELDLPVNPGKSTDSRAKAFARKYGVNVQVEVDALPPDTLARLFEDAVTPYWDRQVFDQVIVKEARIKQEVRDALTGIRW